MCTYNVRASGFFFLFFSVKILAKLVEFTLQKQNIPKISQFLCQKIAIFKKKTSGRGPFVIYIYRAVKKNKGTKVKTLPNSPPNILLLYLLFIYPLSLFLTYLDHCYGHVPT